MISPNGDGKNDVAYFCFDNPQQSSVPGSIYSLLGAHVVGSDAAELIHTGQAFLQAKATATVIAETLFNYPTLSDLYRHAAMEALGEKWRRGGGLRK